MQRLVLELQGVAENYFSATRFGKKGLIRNLVKSFTPGQYHTSLMQAQLREIFSFLRNPEAFLTQKSYFPPGKGLLYALGNSYVVLIGLITKTDSAYYALPVMIITCYSIYKLWKHSKRPRPGEMVRTKSQPLNT